MTVLAFGIVADILGQSSFTVDSVNTTDALRDLLEDRFPVLKNIPFAMAVNRQIIAAPAPLTSTETIALLPPFSGG